MEHPTERYLRPCRPKQHPRHATNRKKWKVSQAGDGDIAIVLSCSPDDVNEPIDPDEDRKLVRRIDFMILPSLAVCYIFLDIDKTTLSFAAIFGIKDGLHVKRNEYNWLSSIYYFGFLVKALTTNLLLQRLPVGKYL